MSAAWQVGVLAVVAVLVGDTLWGRRSRQAGEATPAATGDAEHGCAVEPVLPGQE